MNCLFISALILICSGESLASFLKFGSCPNPPIIPTFNTKQYSGMWYEYGRTPNQFEIDAVCVTANYTYLDDTHIGVQNFNYNFKKNNATNYANGSAYVKNPSEPNRLSVGFPIKFLGFNIYTQWGNYDVYDTDYKTYSLVVSCQPIIPGFLNLKYIWILTRQKTLDQNTANRLLSLANSKGMDSSGFQLTDQTCSN